MDQKEVYWPDSSNVFRSVSFWIDSVKSVDWGVAFEEGASVPLVAVCTGLRANGVVEGGRRARARWKAGEGKTVSDFMRTFVVVSGCRR